VSYRKIEDGIFYVGVIDWNRRLFDELIPLPEGTSYNSYIVKGSEKTALIDAADPAFEEEFFCTLRALGKEIGFGERLDYIVANHGEQDHSGLIPKVLEHHPETKVVTNSKAKKVLADHLHIPDDRFIVIDDGGTLSLGDLTLEIIAAPWVHWPETQLVYLRERKMLFSCDMFGAHFATSNIFDTSDERFRIGAKRYFAEIMMPFRANILKHHERLAKYDIACICPSHGPIHRDTAFIVDAMGVGLLTL